MVELFNAENVVRLTFVTCVWSARGEAGDVGSCAGEGYVRGQPGVWWGLVRGGGVEGDD